MEANYEGHGHFYRGKIAAVVPALVGDDTEQGMEEGSVRFSYTYNIDYDDGDKEKGVSAEFIIEPRFVSWGTLGQLFGAFWPKA